MDTKRWLAAYVKMHHEKKVRSRLAQMGIEHFLPVQEEVRQWSDRKKKVERVLIPMMIFVHVDPVEQKEVLNLPSVLRYLVLRGEHAPAEIPHIQMEQFRMMLDFSESPVQFDPNNFQPGEKIKVVKGPLAGLEGELLTVNGKTTLSLRIEQLGCASVEIDVSLIEKINERN